MLDLSNFDENMSFLPIKCFRPKSATRGIFLNIHLTTTDVQLLLSVRKPTEFLPAAPHSRCQFHHLVDCECGIVASQSLISSFCRICRLLLATEASSLPESKWTSSRPSLHPQFPIEKRWNPHKSGFCDKFLLLLTIDTIC